MHIYTPKKVAGLLVLVLWATGIPRSAEAVLEVFQVNSGNTAYLDGDYEKSAEKYKEALKKDSESDIINFNLGAAYYKQNRYDEALDHLRKAVLSDDDPLREQAHYNLGNTLYQSGRLFLADRDLDTAIQYYEEALAEYEKAMDINPDDADARFNYEYVKKELEQLKQQNQQQDQQQKDQQDQQKDQQQKDQQKDQQQKDQQKDQQQKDQQKDQQQKDQQQDQQQQDQQQDQQQQDQQQKDQQQQDQQQDQQQQDQQQDQQQQQNQQQQDQQQQDQQQDQQQQDQQQQDQKQNQKPNRQPSAAEQSAADFDDLTLQEAEMLLDDYKQNDEPKGLLPIRPRMIPDPVTKDW
ncbi:MAG: tetratricopeptide repeat protein [Candidatus Omnitrophica bacterium]|nr:tetratricopeptide repeat protein [Candidatus Omnitrophota bacterium]MCB9721249.1 tetratricopeptide repeat protein [Candidatus Omnitrophota bacterium]